MIQNAFCIQICGIALLFPIGIIEIGTFYLDFISKQRRPRPPQGWLTNQVTESELK